MGIVHYHCKWLSAIHPLKPPWHLMKAVDCLSDLFQGTSAGPGRRSSSQQVVHIHLPHQRRTNRYIGVGPKEVEGCTLRLKIEIAREKISPFHAVADDLFARVGAGIHKGTSVLVVHIDDGHSWRLRSTPFKHQALGGKVTFHVFVIIEMI